MYIAMKNFTILLYLRNGISEWAHKCDNSQHCSYSKSNSRRDGVFRNPEWQPGKHNNKKGWRVNLNKRVRQPSSEDKLCDQMGVSTCKMEVSIIIINIHNKELQIETSNWNRFTVFLIIYVYWSWRSLDHSFLTSSCKTE